MIYPMYVIRDVKVGFDAQFMVQMNEAAACRGFEYIISNKDSMQGKFPADYEMYEVGFFDTDSGQINPTIPPKFIMNGGSVVEK